MEELKKNTVSWQKKLLLFFSISVIIFIIVDLYMFYKAADYFPTNNNQNIPVVNTSQ